VKLVILPGFSNFGLMEAVLNGVNEDLRNPHGKPYK
jgi:hypothetical protein